MDSLHALLYISCSCCSDYDWDGSVCLGLGLSSLLSIVLEKEFYDLLGLPFFSGRDAASTSFLLTILCLILLLSLFVNLGKSFIHPGTSHPLCFITLTTLPLASPPKNYPLGIAGETKGRRVHTCSSAPDHRS